MFGRRCGDSRRCLRRRRFCGSADRRTATILSWRRYHLICTYIATLASFLHVPFSRRHAFDRVFDCASQRRSPRPIDLASLAPHQTMGAEGQQPPAAKRQRAEAAEAASIPPPPRVAALFTASAELGAQPSPGAMHASRIATLVRRILTLPAVCCLCVCLC